MLAPILVLTAVVLTGQPAHDTTFAVSRDARLHLSTLSGDIEVQIWDRNEVRVTTDGPDGERLSIQRSGTTIRVKPVGRYAHRAIDFRLTVPRWLPLELAGTNTDITVAGSEAAVTATTVNGDVHIRGGRGVVTATSIEGDVRLEGTQGKMTATSVDGDLTIQNATGELRANTVDGSIDLVEVDASVVEVNTVDGDLGFRGPIRPAGRYTLATHDGDITMVVVGEPNATISVSTFDGELESEFPITVDGIMSGREVSFTLGNGSARVRLEAFDGTIRLARGER